jgi:regulator of RNase E activity RraA
VVKPGDVIVGDQNGVVVVPRDIADELLDRLRLRAAREADYTSAVRRGEFDNGWVDRLLDENGVAIEAHAGAA